MNQELKEYKTKLGQLSINEQKLRDLHLRKLSLGEIQGPLTGYASFDKPWLKYYEEANLVEENNNDKSIYETIKSKNIHNLEKTALKYYGTKVTYKELFENIEEYASRLKQLNVKKGDIVSICMPSTPETIYFIYALNKIGAVCDMLDPRSNENQIQYYLTENKSKLLIICESYYLNLSEKLTKLNLDNIIVAPITPSMGKSKLKLLLNAKSMFDNLKITDANNVIRWKDFLALDKSNKVETEYNDKDLSFIIHSSGTTSVPKGIMLSNKNVNSIAYQYAQTSLNLNPGDKFLSVIPVFASFGVVASINLPLYLSLEIVLTALINPKIFVKLVEKEHPNFTLTIPENLKALKDNYKGDDLSFFYGPGCGGYSLDSTKEREINNFLKSKNSPSPMLMGWGMSELSSTACLETPACSKELSSGIPLLNTKISIFNPNTDEELKYYEEGEICVNGPTIMHGYLNNEKKTNNTIKIHSDGQKWLHSGDIGYIDEDGRIFPVDRIDRMIIKGIDGFKIFPQKIEEVISQCSYIKDCVVVGATGPNGIYPKAYITLKDNYDKKINIINEVKKICQQKLTERAIPDEFEIITEVPYTAMGKIDFKKLEQNSNSSSNKKSKKKVRKR